jgi:hypothetical protein
MAMFNNMSSILELPHVNVHSIPNVKPRNRIVVKYKSGQRTASPGLSDVGWAEVGRSGHCLLEIFAHAIPGIATWYVLLVLLQ